MNFQVSLKKVAEGIREVNVVFSPFDYSEEKAENATLITYSNIDNDRMKNYIESLSPVEFKEITFSDILKNYKEGKDRKPITKIEAGEEEFMKNYEKDPKKSIDELRKYVFDTEGKNLLGDHNYLGECTSDFCSMNRKISQARNITEKKFKKDYNGERNIVSIGPGGFFQDLRLLSNLNNEFNYFFTDSILPKWKGENIDDMSLSYEVLKELDYEITHPSVLADIVRTIFDAHVLSLFIHVLTRLGKKFKVFVFDNPKALERYFNPLVLDNQLITMTYEYNGEKTIEFQEGNKQKAIDIFVSAIDITDDFAFLTIPLYNRLRLSLVCKSFFVSNNDYVYTENRTPRHFLSYPHIEGSIHDFFNSFGKFISDLELRSEIVKREEKINTLQNLSGVVFDLLSDSFSEVTSSMKSLFSSS